ncbi:MAG: glycosyltransferase family 4 protein [Oscillatoria sp. Prado101]|nr:glycosyltransferase family 4 protein [Oscillatoria sp. Prado101]
MAGISEIMMAEFKPADIIIFHDSCSWKELPVILRCKCRAKLLIHDHHYGQEFEKSNVISLPRFRLMLKLAYGMADRVVAVSHAQAKWMTENKLVKPAKLRVIQQSTKLEDLLALPSKRVEMPLILAAYGRFCQQKGFDVLIKAMRLIPQQKVRLYLGGYGPDEEALQELARGQENIKFLGTIRDVPAFLTACDVVVIPSRREPWGNVCLEAKAAGKPVIVSRVDGLIEQVTDCGILVPPEDPHSLADAIEKVCSLPESTLQVWGQQGRESVSQAWENYVMKWEALLWEMLVN